MKDNSLTLKATPAGRRFIVFLATINTGDPDRLRDYILDAHDEPSLKEFGADGFLNWYLEIFKQTGGFMVHKVFLSEDYFIMVVLQARSDSTLYLHKMRVAQEHPYKITEYVYDRLDEAMPNR
jgi:hypothetical protein